MSACVRARDNACGYERAGVRADLAGEGLGDAGLDGHEDEQRDEAQHRQLLPAAAR